MSQIVLWRIPVGNIVSIVPVIAIVPSIVQWVYYWTCVPPPDDANIWEEDLESESNIRYDRNGLVIGATLNKLVERVTSTRDHG